MTIPRTLHIRQTARRGNPTVDKTIGLLLLFPTILGLQLLYNQIEAPIEALLVFNGSMVNAIKMSRKKQSVDNTFVTISINTREMEQ